jgi:thymidylate kinase
MSAQAGGRLADESPHSPRGSHPRPDWVTLPWSRSPRWYVPRNPGLVTRRSFLIYHPVTIRSRVGWEASRVLAARGAFRLLRASAMMPREIWDPVAPLIPPGGALAVAKANHPGRFLALVVGNRGELRAFVKVARDGLGSEALRRERWALETLGPLLPAPLFAPNVLDHRDGVLVLEPVEWRARAEPWKLPTEVAYSLGSFFRATATTSGNSAGALHGDCTPWNLLRTPSGWALVDWENAENESPPFFDVFHFLVQASAELRRPTKRAIVRGLELEGWVGACIEAYAGCQIDPSEAGRLFPEYLRRSLRALEPSTPGRASRIRHNLSRLLRDRETTSRSPRGSSSSEGDGVRGGDGLFILIVGPDGSGKSSLATRLAGVAREAGRSVQHLHWRPGLLPQAGNLGGAMPDPSRPHGREAHGASLSLFRVLYYWVDFFLGLRLRARPLIARGGLVVMERGWWDFAVDPLRYRVKVGRAVVERLGRLLPPPDLVIFLEAPSEVLSGRKGELPAREAARQMRTWRQIRLPTASVRVFLDASRSLDDLVGEVEGHVAELQRVHRGDTSGGRSK